MLLDFNGNNTGHADPPLIQTLLAIPLYILMILPRIFAIALLFAYGSAYALLPAIINYICQVNMFEKLQGYTCQIYVSANP